MLAQIQSHELFFLRHPQSHQGIQHSEDDQGPEKGKSPRCYDGDGLGREELGIAKKEAVGSCRVNGLGSEEASGQGSPGPADPMYPHHIERVVVAQPRFEITG